MGSRPDSTHPDAEIVPIDASVAVDEDHDDEVTPGERQAAVGRHPATLSRRLSE